MIRLAPLPLTPRRRCRRARHCAHTARPYSAHSPFHVLVDSHRPLPRTIQPIKKRPLARWDRRTPLSKPYRTISLEAGGKRHCSPTSSRRRTPWRSLSWAPLYLSQKNLSMPNSGHKPGNSIERSHHKTLPAPLAADRGIWIRGQINPD